LAGCLRRRVPPVGRGDGRTAPQLSRGGRTHHAAGPRLRVRLRGDRAQAARLPRPRQAHRGDLAARAGRREGAAALRPAGRRAHQGGLRADRPRAGRHRGARVPRLLPDRPRHRQVLRAGRHLVPGKGQRRELGGLLRAGDHRRGSRPARPAFRAVPVGGKGRPARHRPGYRAPAPGGGDPVRLRQVRPGQGGPGRQRDHLPAPDGAARRGPGAGVHAAAARRLGETGGAQAVRGGPAGPGRCGRPRAGHRARRPDAAAARHLGIHSGGMVICDRPVGEVCPVEWARMPGRSVLQWDKEDCAYAGLVKFDLLGLGMLTALRDCFELVAAHHGVSWSLHSIPQEDPAVYDMLCEADTVGVFQVESRAQMATLPRLRPRKFYDLVIEVALIRPGPIQGGSVHPYMRRRRGDEPPHLPHESMHRALGKTFGVPLFQEQMMQLAVDCAGFSPAEADRLRQAMSSKRGPERIEELRGRLLAGMAARRIPDEVGEDIYAKILAFSSYGFPESHAISFAYLVYASAWLKRYYPAAFTAALLRAQPMGFYSPASLIGDARRHGVHVRGVDINASAAAATLEKPETPAGQPVIRLGLATVRNLGSGPAAVIVAGQPYGGLEDFALRTRLPAAALEALAMAGAFGCFGMSRREALLAAGAAATIRTGQLPGTTVGLAAPPLAAMTAAEETFADLWSTGTFGTHPLAHIRDRLAGQGVIGAAELKTAQAGATVVVAGLVTHRQQPGTARGVVFLSLEDETGMANVICPPPVWERHRRLAIDAGALLVRGRVERMEESVSLLATGLQRLPVVATSGSRDFR